ncbi:AAA family ATPase [Zunongwangia sp. SCSIO 43204]|uniref:ATP-binding protein n=1 Tax=Zunongwangia sp. SCSIO 43204 TaxID=2779359 RepID=UPI001CA81701|nr:ATP-binding protein [Zunongwangia sp. SCSIO 43204]UAB84335.1 AAA family ATPase [Zunongwangia sp. SCSIO 43204]
MSNLRLNELIVVQGDKYVYREKFDHKVNIIRGDNSTGKSSIANFIFFILGGEFTEFLPEAKRCDYVIAELLVNNAPVTVRRNIDKNDNYHVMTKRPMYINVAPLQQAIKSQIKGWKIYQYSQTDRQESFSQKLFQLLNFPDISSENQETITMNQILRLIYIDQLSNLSDLMRNEDFDSPSVRDAVGNLLLGTYSDEKLKFERQLKEVKKEYDKISTQTAAMKDVFKESSFEFNTTKIEGEIQKLEEQLKKVNSSIANPEDILKNARPSVTKKELDSNRHKLIQIKTKYQDLNEELKNTNLAYIDGKEFIKVIEDKINDIDISIKWTCNKKLDK